jgi:hypothetical protein
MNGNCWHSMLVQPALLLASASATLTGFFLLLFHSTCAGLSGIFVTCSGFLFFLFGANCTGVSPTSPRFSGFLFGRFGTTGTGLASTSATRCTSDGETSTGHQGCKAQPCQNLLKLLVVHALLRLFIGWSELPLNPSPSGNHSRDPGEHCQWNEVARLACRVAVDSLFRSD